uniref:Secreted protein n=1 Tax=Romanomermis culicivorax TaxID=13658 RepID=A0A915J047_ROMCU
MMLNYGCNLAILMAATRGTAKCRLMLTPAMTKFKTPMCFHRGFLTWLRPTKKSIASSSNTSAYSFLPHVTDCTTNADASGHWDRGGHPATRTTQIRHHSSPMQCKALGQSIWPKNTLTCPGCCSMTHSRLRLLPPPMSPN